MDRAIAADADYKTQFDDEEFAKYADTPRFRALVGAGKN
jgi:hypothetical protein